MSSAKSPYKEFGMMGTMATTGPKRRRATFEKGLFDTRTTERRSVKHVWDLNLKVAGLQVDGTQKCLRCMQPRFIVDGYRCKGKI